MTKPGRLPADIVLAKGLIGPATRRSPIAVDGGYAQGPTTPHVPGAPAVVDRWVYVGDLWADARTCARCGRQFIAGSAEPYTYCRACEPNEARLELSVDGLAAWRAVRASHVHYHKTRGLAGGPAGGEGDMKDHSIVAQRAACIAASNEWWIRGDALFAEFDRLFPEGTPVRRSFSWLHD